METASIPAALPEYDRQAPYSLEGEISVLGGMLIDNDAVARTSLEIGVGTGLHIETLPAIAIGFLADAAPGNPLDRPTYVQETPGQ